MCLVHTRVLPLLIGNILHCYVLVAFIFFRQILCKVSYALCISSILLMTLVENIMILCNSFLGTEEKT